MVAILLSSCYSQPEWFEKQGINITECGPTVAANAINWAGGSSNRKATRSIYQSPLLWTLPHIYSAISRSGVNVAYKHIDDLNLIKNKNQIGIFYINRSHFIMVDFIDGQYYAYDPLFGVGVKTEAEIKSMSWVNYILVYKY
ncbi:hypothetical protein N9043_00660 [bacterium]|nr:hypothetical protein [bacterium]